MSRSQMIKLLQKSAVVLSFMERGSPPSNPQIKDAAADAKSSILQLTLQILEGVLAQQPTVGQPATELQQENTALFNAVTDILSAIHIEHAKNSTSSAVDIGGVQITILQLIIQIIQSVLSQVQAPPVPAEKPCPCTHPAALAQAAPAQPDAIRPLLTGDSVIYGYDDLGRLQTLTFANGTVVTYNLDSVGNRTSVVTTCGGSGC